ncbi:cytochrome c [Paraliomyxa miuraensis]|uniref:cytochrome c n=1 Tax=Paraliomyxa miuraensis TaxID=376150 RepID=UPI00225BF1A0|nr:c-type cytochrome [Paraliomyxa miuraensis]MCX4242714.1 c-type cytochrome [Paraliomyxa miuraensis]
MTGASRSTASRRGRGRRWLIKLGLGGVLLVGVLLALGAGALTLLGMPTYEVPKVAFEAEPTPQRVERGKRLVSMLCRRCHYDGATRALTGRVLPETRLGRPSAPNLTREPQVGIGGWSASELAVLLRTGIHPKTGVLVPPSFMPRWPRLADEDLAAIVAFLGSEDAWVAPHAEEPPPTQYSLVARYRALWSWSPLPYPRAPIEAPAEVELEAHGAYLVDHVLQCAACHSARWGDFDALDPPRTPGYLAGGAATGDVNGVVLRAANLTPDATGLAGWTSEQLRRVLVDGFGRDGKVVRWPMTRHAGLERIEVEAIHAYLQTLDPVVNVVEESPPYRIVGRKADAGRHFYVLYGCQYCHGDKGVGVADLRGAAKRFATDEELTTFLRDPSKHDPLPIMPAYAGVIGEDEYAELCEYVRRLGG